MSDPLSLNIWCPTADQDRLEALLTPFAPGLRAKILEPLDEDLSQLGQQSNTPGLIFFDDLPGPLRATFDAADVALPDRLESWRRKSEALLTALRHTRNHLTLAPTSAIQTDPEALQQAIAARYGLRYDPDLWRDTGAAALASPAPAHLAMMVALVARLEPQTGAVLKRLSEASLPIEGVDLTGEAAAQALTTTALDPSPGDKARLALMNREAAFRRLSEETARHEAAATYLKEELTRRSGTQAAQSTELERLRATADQLEKMRAEQRRMARDHAQSLEKLTRNLQMRDSRLAALAEALCSYEDEALALRDDVSALRRSTSWRLTAPVRALGLLARKILRR